MELKEVRKEQMDDEKQGGKEGRNATTKGIVNELLT